MGSFTDIMRVDLGVACPSAAVTFAMTSPTYMFQLAPAVFGNVYPDTVWVCWSADETAVTVRGQFTETAGNTLVTGANPVDVVNPQAGVVEFAGLRGSAVMPASADWRNVPFTLSTVSGTATGGPVVATSEAIHNSQFGIDAYRSWSSYQYTTGWGSLTARSRGIIYELNGELYGGLVSAINNGSTTENLCSTTQSIGIEFDSPTMGWLRTRGVQMGIRKIGSPGGVVYADVYINGLLAATTKTFNSSSGGSSSYGPVFLEYSGIPYLDIPPNSRIRIMTRCTGGNSTVGIGVGTAVCPTTNAPQKLLDYYRGTCRASYVKDAGGITTVDNIFPDIVLTSTVKDLIVAGQINRRNSMLMR